MILTEDKIIDWVESQRGLLITRRTLNFNNFDFNNCADNTYVCITGYNQIISDFFTNIINRFSKCIILIIIESDVVVIKEEWLNNMKLKHCFTWNKPFHHPKISCLPIGLNYNRQFNVLNEWLNKTNPDAQEKNENENGKKNKNKKLLCMNYSPQTNPERVKIIDRANNEWNGFCDILEFIPPLSSNYIPSHIEGKIRVDVSNPKCYDEWVKYKFVLSPPGAGIDCHRTWEAVSVGCIPIVLSSELNELYEDLPILIVETWDQITDEYLENRFNEITEKTRAGLYNYEKITHEYWVNKISDVPRYPQKIHFMTYGNDKFEKSKRRLLNEAAQFGEFASINGYGPNDLSDKFREKYKEILNQSRGGGYWIWRPVILHEALKFINENDILVYLDAGCKLNKEGKPRFHEYIRLLNENENRYGVMSFQMSGNTGPGGLEIEKKWTIKEIFDNFNVDINSDIANSGQYLGGILVMKKNEHLKKYMNMYVSTVLTKPLLCTDVYNSQNQISEFRENRHEQSITSVLRKIMGSVVIDGDESWMVPFGEGESLKYPFWAARIRQ
jgi:hypothetical protein